MNTREQFAKLHQLLVQQNHIIDRLISAGEEQAQYLRKNDAKGLQQVLQQQSALSARLEALEKDRMQIQRALEKGLNLPGGSTLRDLAVYTDETSRRQLNDLGSSLREKAFYLQEINALNRALTNQALRFTSFMLNLLQPQTRETGYTRDGSIKKNPSSKFRLDKSV